MLNRAAPSQQYGQRAAQERAMQAVPMAPPPASSPAGAGGGAPPLPGLLDPTGRPSEPITAGLGMGAGPGLEILPIPKDNDLDELRALYQQFPNEELRQAIEEAEGGW